MTAECRPPESTPDGTVKVQTRRLCIASAAIGAVAMIGGLWDALNIALGLVMGLSIPAIAEPPADG